MADDVAALAVFYGRTLLDLALVLFEHRPDGRGDCVSCSGRRGSSWRDCVHAYAARMAVRELRPSGRCGLERLLSSGQLSEAAVRAGNQVIAAIDAP
jgi:hypothetical protein